MSSWSKIARLTYRNFFKKCGFEYDERQLAYYYKFRIGCLRELFLIKYSFLFIDSKSNLR